MNTPGKELFTYNVVIRTNGDERRVPITNEQYLAIKEAKQKSRSSDNVEIVDAISGKVLYDGELGAIKEYEPINTKKLYEKQMENLDISVDEKRRAINRAGREEWLNNWLAVNDQDGSIMKNAMDEAIERHPRASEKGMIGEKFAQLMARVIIRQSYGCPIA